MGRKISEKFCKPNHRGSLMCWIRQHPAGLRMIDRWLELRAANETGWSLAKLVDEMGRRWSTFTFSRIGLREWMIRHRSEEFRRVSGDD
jgi:hypothetical protein